MTQAQTQQNTIDQALALSVARFQGMVDEDGQPYILHCLRVMMSFTDPVLQQIGLMHDLIEDTSVTLEELRQQGFSEEIVHAVSLLTRTADIGYAEYVIRLKENALAKQVKLADLRDNSALWRALYRSSRPEKDLKQAGRYILSYQFLEDRIDQADYLRLMSDLL
jgi:(p)ppGpp synthase/HD superfamily hydrolase